MTTFYVGKKTPAFNHINFFFFVVLRGLSLCTLITDYNIV